MNLGKQEPEFEWRSSAPAAQESTPEQDAALWLNLFAPVLDDPVTLGAEECRQRIQLAEQLREEGRAIRHRLEAQGTSSNPQLATTFLDALRELDGAQEAYRRRLGFLTPGDPAAGVDLAAMRARLAEVSARREIESIAPGTAALPQRLELPTAPPNWGTAGFTGIFALGWLSFTTVHAVFMIGGFFRAVGGFALLLLGFYAIFFGVGFAMAKAAFNAACREEISVDGRELKVRRSFLGWSSERAYQLAADCQAYVDGSPVVTSHTWPPQPQAGLSASNSNVVLRDDRGFDVRIAAGRPRPEQERIAARINEYLLAARR